MIIKITDATKSDDCCKDDVDLTSLMRFERRVEPGLYELGAVGMVGVKVQISAFAAARVPEMVRVKVTEREEDGAGDHVLGPDSIENFGLKYGLSRDCSWSSTDRYGGRNIGTHCLF